MNPSWETPPNGDFASYVERLTAQAAQRHLMAQRAASQASQPGFDASSGAPPSETSALQGTGDPGAAEQARALFSPPGLQLPSEHPLARGLRQVLKKLESNLQGIAQQQQQKKK